MHNVYSQQHLPQRINSGIKTFILHISEREILNTRYEDFVLQCRNARKNEFNFYRMFHRDDVHLHTVKMSVYDENVSRRKISQKEE